MKLFSVRLAATFLLDLTDITLYILGKPVAVIFPDDFIKMFYQLLMTERSVQIVMNHITRIRDPLNTEGYILGITQSFM